MTGRRKGRKFARPKFRSRKNNRQVIRFARNAKFRVVANGRLRLPKIGDIRVRWSRPLPGPASSVAVIRDRAGRYFASFVVRVAESPLPPVEQEVGLDLQRTQSRAVWGSTNRSKAVIKVARAHARVSAARRDWQHKLSTQIIRDNQAVYVEDLCISGLGRTRLAKSIHDVRTWTCGCGAQHDRDINAALNILAAGRADKSNACGAQVRPAFVPAQRREAGIRPSIA